MGRITNTGRAPAHTDTRARTHAPAHTPAPAPAHGGETVNIVEAKIHLQQMREDLSRFPTDPDQRQKRWVLSMQIASYDMAIRQHEGTYREPWL